MKVVNRRLGQSREAGFTLIELLIVIIILGILAAIVVFAVGTTRKDAVASSCKTDFKSIQLSAEAINTKSGSYPAATADLTDPTKGGLLKTFPSGADYAFAYAGGGTAYTITVSGPNVTGGPVKDNDLKAVLDAACSKP